jgi:hypothetical protein
MICFTTCAFVRRFSCSKDCLLLCGAASLMLRCTQMSGNWHPSIGSERFNPRFIRERIHTGLVVSSLLACYGSCWILLDLDLDQFRLRSQRLRSHRSDSRFGYILNSADPSATWLGNVGNVGNVGTGDEIGWKVSKERRSSMPSAPYTHVFFMFFHLEGRKTACRNVSNIFWMVGDGEAVHIRWSSHSRPRRPRVSLAVSMPRLASKDMWVWVKTYYYLF